MKELKETELDVFLKELDWDNNELKINRDETLSFLEPHIKKKAVLGFDIYQYSQYPFLEQTLIPHLFKKLYKVTIGNCIRNESFFLEYKNQKDFEDKFIDTGDGGFQIFRNPFEALIFGIYFQANIFKYNSGNKNSSYMFEIIGGISLRYSLTYDKVFNYKKNYYGAAIINCARIMSRDKLNRFLLDNNTIAWFNAEFNSIETCSSLEPQVDFPTIPLFKEHFDIETYESILFPLGSNIIKSIDILKIGEIKSKLDTLSIYSAHIQILFKSKGKDFKRYHCTLGNLNSSGLGE